MYLLKIDIGSVINYKCIYLFNVDILYVAMYFLNADIGYVLNYYWMEVNNGK